MVRAKGGQRHCFAPGGKRQGSASSTFLSVQRERGRDREIEREKGETRLTAILHIYLLYNLLHLPTVPPYTIHLLRFVPVIRLKMSAVLPFRDINVHASSNSYAFSSPSSPHAPTLVVDRPSGQLRLHDGNIAGGHRVSSISGLLGIIKLRLGMKGPIRCAMMRASAKVSTQIAT